MFTWSEVLGVHANCSIRLQARGAVLKMENGGTWLSPLHQPFEDKRVGLCAQRTGLPGDILPDRSLSSWRNRSQAFGRLDYVSTAVHARRGELPNTVHLRLLIETVAASVSKCSVAGGRTICAPAHHLRSLRMALAWSGLICPGIIQVQLGSPSSQRRFVLFAQ